MTPEDKSITIDTEKVIRSQKSMFLKKMPRFMIRIIERIIHQKELNELLFSLKDKEEGEFVLS